MTRALVGLAADPYRVMRQRLAADDLARQYGQGNMLEVIQELRSWQDLVGSALGVIGAFAVAWWAASHAARRDTRNAAFQVIEDLVEYAAVTESMLEGGLKVNTDMPDLTQVQRAALGMVIYRPKLSPFFFESAARLRLLDPVLVVRLSTVRKAFEAAEAFYERLAEAERRVLISGNSSLDNTAIHNMLNSAIQLSRTAATEAKDAAADLESLFVKRGAWLRRAVLSSKPYQARRLRAFRLERERKSEAGADVRGAFEPTEETTPGRA